MDRVVQEVAVVAARLPAASGVYRVTDEERNGERVWVGDFGKRLFSAKNGRWYIGNVETIEKGSGWVRSTVHNGAPPYVVEGWEAFDKVGCPWRPDKTIQVVLKDRSPSMTESDVSGSLGFEAKLPHTPRNVTPSKVVKPQAVPLTDITSLRHENAMLKSQLQQAASLKHELAKQQQLREALQAQVKQLTTGVPVDDVRRAEERHRAEVDELRQQLAERDEEVRAKDAVVAAQTVELKQLMHRFANLEQQVQPDGLVYMKLRRWAQDVLQK